MQNNLEQKIELLGPDLLDQNRAIVEEIKRMAASLGIDLGWHYLLDLSWIIAQLQPAPGLNVMDAGAGIGLMQWYLAGKGVDVISVDRSSRASMPLRFRAHYPVRGLRPQDLWPASQVISHNFKSTPSLVRKGAGLARDSFWALLSSPSGKAGGVSVYNQDLRALVDVPDGSLDAVVAVSALEHNPPEDLDQVVAELMRVLKPGGALLATLGAAPDQDWFHQPSHGWCYTDGSLRRLFGLPADAPSNYNRYAPLLASLVGCSELRDHLAGFYIRSGDNGMPWGKWDPRYLPVGICKIKS
jgi:SAM-dependent methyltransferase